MLDNFKPLLRSLVLNGNHDVLINDYTNPAQFLRDTNGQYKSIQCGLDIMLFGDVDGHFIPVCVCKTHEAIRVGATHIPYQWKLGCEDDRDILASFGLGWHDGYIPTEFITTIKDGQCKFTSIVKSDKRCYFIIHHNGQVMFAAQVSDTHSSDTRRTDKYEEIAFPIDGQGFWTNKRDIQTAIANAGSLLDTSKIRALKLTPKLIDAVGRDMSKFLVIDTLDHQSYLIRIGEDRNAATYSIIHEGARLPNGVSVLNERIPVALSEALTECGLSIATPTIADGKLHVFGFRCPQTGSFYRGVMCQEANKAGRFKRIPYEEYESIQMKITDKIEVEKDEAFDDSENLDQDFKVVPDLIKAGTIQADAQLEPSKFAMIYMDDNRLDDIKPGEVMSITCKVVAVPQSLYDVVEHSTRFKQWVEPK